MTSARSNRTKARIDYKLFNNTGLKVPKIIRADLSKMENLIDQEFKIVLKIKRFISEYSLDLLGDIKDIGEGINEQRVLSEDYESVHVQLKRVLGENDAETYTNYDEQIGNLIDWGIKAKSEIHKRKEIESQAKLRNEEFYLRNTINNEIENINEESSMFIEDIGKNINFVKGLHKDYNTRLLKIGELGDEFHDEFRKVYNEQNSNVNLFIQAMMKKIQD